MHNSRKHDPFSPKKHVKAELRHFQRLVSFPNNFFRWFLTFLVLGAVLLVSIHFSEEKGLLKLMEEAKPIWILVGIFLQSLTYLAQANIWKSGLASVGHDVPAHRLMGLSLAQLFINQALPSASVSGAYFVSRAFEQRGVPRGATAITLGLSFISYFEAYGLAALLALMQLWDKGHLQGTAFWISSFLLMLYCLMLVPMARRFHLSGLLQRFRIFRNLLKAGKEIDLQRLKLGLIVRATGLQLLVFVFDFLTLFSMLRALGIHASPGPVFTAYMAAYLARTIGFLPGGVGVFEAAAISALHTAGVTVAGSIAATLLYRGLSFWLPMLPGLFLVRKEFHHEKRSSRYKIENYWEMGIDRLLDLLKSTGEGVSRDEASHRLILQGPNLIHTHHTLAVWEILWNQIKSPLVLLLVFASAVSFSVGEWVDGLIILIILVFSSGIGSWREWGAQFAVEKLKSRLAPRASVRREGESIVVPSSELVPGDIVELSAGSLVPADLLVISAQDCYVNEAALTGESFPVRKLPVPGGVPASTSLTERRNALFLGSHVQTGIARCLVVNTGPSTMFGTISESLIRAGPQTDFDRNITSFGMMMIQAMLLIVITVFAVNAFTSGLSIQSLMFSVALAVGLSPELLPLIINYDLAMSARRLAQAGLLVRHPKALENIAAADVLCTDKTGTLTEGALQLSGAFDPQGHRSEKVLEMARLNASFQSGISNPLDQVLMKTPGPPVETRKKLGEIPFDFNRKRMSVLIEEEGNIRVITKGAFQKVLDICRFDGQGKQKIIDLYEKYSTSGGRVLGVATKEVKADVHYGPDLESQMQFLGILVFTDRPKEGVTQTLKELRDLGISIKIISGDNTLVTTAVAKQVGLESSRVLEGAAIDALSDEGLPHLAEETVLFTQVDPHQKERIVNALRKKGHTVVYMGDGINDVSSMHASDASISVESAVDVAKNTADLVLMEKSLELIKEGIREGRTTFTNSMKYINITMSANLGNMISMAVASIMLPFLPLLAGQVLLNNLLSDIPSLGLATDNVDEEKIRVPTRWDLQMILRYMLSFGLISTLFDLLTFYVLLRVLKASVHEFRTAWFVESLLTELLVVMVLRTAAPFYKGRPSRQLLILTALLTVVTLAIPYIKGALFLGFVPLSAGTMGLVLSISLLYLLTTELLKFWLHQKFA